MVGHDVSTMHKQQAKSWSRELSKQERGRAAAAASSLKAKRAMRLDDLCRQQPFGTVNGDGQTPGMSCFKLLTTTPTSLQFSNPEPSKLASLDSPKHDAVMGSVIWDVAERLCSWGIY
jgi:hypothetical protein